MVSKDELLTKIQCNAYDHAYNVYIKSINKKDGKICKNAINEANKKARQAIKDNKQYKAAYHGAFLDAMAAFLGFK